MQISSRNENVVRAVEVFSVPVRLEMEGRKALLSANQREASVPEVSDALNTIMQRPINLLGMRYTRAFGEESPEADRAEGSYTAVFALDTQENGSSEGLTLWTPGDFSAGTTYPFYCNSCTVFRTSLINSIQVFEKRLLIIAHFN